MNSKHNANSLIDFSSFQQEAKSTKQRNEMNHRRLNLQQQQQSSTRWFSINNNNNSNNKEEEVSTADYSELTFDDNHLHHPNVLAATTSTTLRTIPSIHVMKPVTIERSNLLTNAILISNANVMDRHYHNYLRQCLPSSNHNRRTTITTNTDHPRSVRSQNSSYASESHSNYSLSTSKLYRNDEKNVNNDVKDEDGCNPSSDWDNVHHDNSSSKRKRFLSRIKQNRSAAANNFLRTLGRGKSIRGRFEKKEEGMLFYNINMEEMDNDQNESENIVTKMSPEEVLLRIYNNGKKQTMESIRLSDMSPEDYLIQKECALEGIKYLIDEHNYGASSNNSRESLIDYESRFLSS